MACARGGGEGEGDAEGLTEKRCDWNKEIIVENEAGKGFEFKGKMLAINKTSPELPLLAKMEEQARFTFSHKRKKKTEK